MPVPNGPVSLVPFPVASIEDAWGWLNEFPKANFDDDGPKSLEDFKAGLLWRVQNHHAIIGVLHAGACVGIIGMKQVSPQRAEFSGICFSKAVHGKGIAFAALSQLIAALWQDEGMRKIEAKHFADNQRVARLFAKLGGRFEGLLRQHVTRNGVPIDCKLVGWIKGE